MSIMPVVPSYDRRSSGFRCIVVQMYNSCKTQNDHNFGHRHATDLYFTFLEMAEKVVLVKFLWHQRGSNPRLILVTIICSLMLNDHGYILRGRRNLHYLLRKMGRGAGPIWSCPQKRLCQKI